MQKSFSMMTHWILRNFKEAKNNFETFDEIWMRVSIQHWGVEPDSIKIATRLRTWARAKNQV